MSTHYEDAAPTIGRGTRGGTLKEMKAGLDRYLRRKGLARSWNGRRTRRQLQQDSEARHD